MHKTIAFIVPLTFLVLSCEKATITEAPVNTPAVVSFKNDVFPWFVEKNCLSCHDDSNEPNFTSAETAFTSFVTNGYIESASPSNSLIITKFNSPHKGISLDAQQKALIENWIKDGAKNN